MNGQPYSPNPQEAPDYGTGAGVCDVCVSYCDSAVNVEVLPEGQCEGVYLPVVAIVTSRCYHGNNYCSAYRIRKESLLVAVLPILHS